MEGRVSSTTAAGPLAPNAWLRWDVVRRALPRGRSDILEIGCGRGAFGARIAARHAYTAVELDAASHATAQARIGAVSPEVRVLHGDLAAIDPAERFDVVCAFEVLEHIEDDEGALREWTARARPGGTVLLSTPAWQRRFGPWDEAVGHCRRYDPRELAELLEKVGLEGVHVTVYGAPLGYLLEAARDRLAHRTGHGGEEERSMEERTASSGRVLQPSSRLTGMVTAAGTWPFRMVQRAFPGKGTGLVAYGRVPGES
jgi:SAM-dependent methyltransferase